MSEQLTYTPAAYWHRIHGEMLEPRQTVTVEVVVEQEPPASTGLRRCYDCKNLKPEHQFRKRRAAKDQLSSHCIDCHREYMRAYMRNKYQTDPEYRAKAQAYQRAYQQKRREAQAVRLDWRGVPFPREATR